jgi:hypothetical protein
LDTGGVNVAATVDTGVINQAVWQANASRTITSFDVDTGLRDLITDAKNELDTGLRDHIDNTDSGLRAHIDDLDTGLHKAISDADTGIRTAVAAVGSDTGTAANVVAIKAKTDSLTFTVAGQVDANIQSVNDVTVTGTGASGDEWGP